MQHTGAVEVGLLAVFLIGVVFAWDGLVRRHIRLARDIIAMQVDIRGWPAILVGLLGLACMLFAGTISIQNLVPIAHFCGFSAACLWQNLVVPPFTWWAPVVGLVISIVAFALWVSGASDLSGPYRRQWLAPGVSDNEKIIVEQVRAALNAAQLPPVDSDAITRAATWIRRNFGFTAMKVRPTETQTHPIDSNQVMQLMRATRTFTSAQVSEAQARVMLRVIVKYYADLYTQVGQAYLWKHHGRYKRRQ